MSTEEWRSVLSGFYEVSDRGRVRRARPSSHRGSRCAVGRLLSPYKGNTEHLRFTAHTGTRRAMLVHRVVAEAFLGPCPAGLEVNHKNGDPSDNRVKNLEYVTGSENMKHAFRTGLIVPLRGEMNGSSKLTAADVVAIRHQHQFGKNSKRAIARRFGVSETTIRQIIKRKKWAHLP